MATSFHLTKAVALSFVVATGVLATSLSVAAQSTPVVPADAAPTRFPAEGLAILDCAPSAPAPTDSCVLRVPPSRDLQKIEKNETGDVIGNFVIQRDMSTISADLVLSKTLVLIDLTPGLRGERRPTWPQERELIAKLVEGLPSNQKIALYGFNEGLERLTDFTTNTTVLAQTIRSLDLRGANTRIATNTRDAITLLGAQTDTILRNLIVVSDGEEEGTRALSEVASAAVEHGVTVSTLGMFWRPVGAPQNGAGLDYLEALSEGTLGAKGGLTLSRRAEAQTNLDQFVAAIGSSLRESGLILSVGEQAEADITVILNKPRLGVANAYDEERVTARFTPEAMRGGAEPPTQAPAEPEEAAPAEEAPLAWHARDWMGMRVLWWMLGVVGLALLGLFVFLGLSRKQRAHGEDGESGGGFLVDPVPVPPVAPAPSPAIAYLVRADTGERLVMRKARVTIGRSETCDLVVSDQNVSRLHAELERRGPDTFTISDAGSLNKTSVNGKVITGPTMIKAGDTVGFGEVKLRFSQA